MDAHITLQLDRSSTWSGLYFSRGDRRVSLDEALAEGFLIPPNDAAAIATLAIRFVEVRDHEFDGIPK